MNTDPFAPTLFDTPCRYPGLLMLLASSGHRSVFDDADAFAARMDAHRRALVESRYRLAQARANRARTEAFYAAKAARRAGVAA